jgi:probable addiction module antidote protein
MEGLKMAKKSPKRRRTTRFDAARYLKSHIDAAGYLQACMEEANGESALIMAALGDIARAYGMSKLAREVGISRAGLHKALHHSGNPSFGTVLKVTQALGLKLIPAAAPKAQ